jgi:hypothetical protein
MKTKILVLVSFIGANLTTPAVASDPMLGDRHLDHVQWFHARPEAHLLNEDPIIVDKRPVPSTTNFQIVVPPLPPAQVVNRVIVVPQQGLIAGTPTSPAALPPAGLTSNITPNRFSAKDLPNGVTIGNHAQPGSILSKPAPVSVKTVHANRHEAPVVPVTALTYPSTQGSGASGSTQSQTSSSAIGKLLKP